MCLAISNNLFLVLQDAPKRFFSTNSRSSDQPNNNTKILFSHPPFPIHGNFCNCNSIWHLYCFAILGSTSTVTHSVKQRLLRNRPGSALRPLATSCAKDYKAHSLQQTSFAESPNRQNRFQGASISETCFYRFTREKETPHYKIDWYS